jgi:hypothetical protein
VFENKTFQAQLINWRATEGRGYGWGLIDLAHAEFDKGFLERNPQYITETLKRFPSELTSGGGNFRTASLPNVNSKIPANWWTKENADLYMDLYKKDFASSYAYWEKKGIKSELDKLEKTAAAIKFSVEQKTLAAEGIDTAAAKKFDSITPKEDPHAIWAKKQRAKNNPDQPVVPGA